MNLKCCMSQSNEHKNLAHEPIYKMVENVNVNVRCGAAKIILQLASPHSDSTSCLFEAIAGQN